MKKTDVAIIGGSGIYRIPGLNTLKVHEEKSNYFGIPSAPITEMELSGAPFYFIPRHGLHHHLLPSEINYRANLFALKELGVKVVVSVSAVGSLQEEFKPGTFVLPSQFIDWTKGTRPKTFFGNGIVAHVSTANPVEASLQERVAHICDEEAIPYAKGGSYICIEGPQFSSRAESAIYRSFGASVIGMTNVPEAYLAKEAGLAYATVAMVTDYDCWKEEHCEVSEIMAVMKHNEQLFHKLLHRLIPDLVSHPLHYTPENKNSVMTSADKLTQEQKEMLETLLR